MMLPTDISLVTDPSFAISVHKFAADDEAFREAFALGFARLLELGVPAFYDPIVASRHAIARLLPDLSHDHGSWGPLFVRLAWHSSGTYNYSNALVGGSNGATMRFAPEASDGANHGLVQAIARLAPVKTRFPEISLADLWTLSAVVAIKEMGGPAIPWRAGRTDDADASNTPPNGRLPDAHLGADHIRSRQGG
jgi:catalase (peroxidase I)